MLKESLTPKRAAAITAVLGLLSLFPPLATDMYLAALGDLAETMQTDTATAELSLSIFFLGLCVGQLVMGPVIDSLGRKGPLIGGTVLFAVTSFALVLTQDIALFNTLRFFQALGACAGMVVSRAVVYDLYEGRRAAKVMTVLVMLLTIGPIVSPTLGSLLFQGFGWRSIFVVMTLVSLVALVLSLIVIPETLPRADRIAAPVRSGRKTAAILLTGPGFVKPALIAGLVQGGMFAFITGSSGVFQGVFGLTPISYGVLFAGIAVALLLFGQLNTLLLNRFFPARILRTGLPVYTAAALMLALVSGTQTLWVFVAPLWLAIGLVGLLSANAMSMSMTAAQGGSGIGSALLGAIQFGVAFAVSTCVALGGTDTALPMALGLLIPAALATILSLSLLRTQGAGVAQGTSSMTPGET